MMNTDNTATAEKAYFPGNPKEFCDFMVTIHGKKIDGLEETCRDLELCLAAHRGALADARRDLARFETYSTCLQYKEPLPDLVLS